MKFGTPLEIIYAEDRFRRDMAETDDESDDQSDFIRRHDPNIN